MTIQECAQSFQQDIAKELPQLVLADAVVEKLSTPLSEEDSTLAEIAGEIVSALRMTPHFLQLRGLSPSSNRSITVALAQAIAAMQSTSTGRTESQRSKVSFTKVAIDPKKAAKNGNATAYSRTSKPLALHTDSSYKATPHELVAFQMVRTDTVGGDTLMMPVERILRHLDHQVIETLQKPVFPFGKADFPVIWKTDDQPRIRYYRSQIDNAVAKGASLSDNARAAIDMLDVVLNQKDLDSRLRLNAGDILFMDNTRVLHGRTAFGDQSDRMMYRIRIEASCLA